MRVVTCSDALAPPVMAWSLFQSVSRKGHAFTIGLSTCCGKSPVAKTFLQSPDMSDVDIYTKCSISRSTLRLSATLHVRRRSGWWELWIMLGAGKKTVWCFCRAIKALFPRSRPVQFSYTLWLFLHFHNQKSLIVPKELLCALLFFFSWRYCWDNNRWS